MPIQCRSTKYVVWLNPPSVDVRDGAATWLTCTKGLDIATNKPSQQERNGVAHHLFGFVPASETYHVRSYVEASTNVVRKLCNKRTNASRAALHTDLIASTRATCILVDSRHSFTWQGGDIGWRNALLDRGTVVATHNRTSRRQSRTSKYKHEHNDNKR
jgi:hypothetical protein